MKNSVFAGKNKHFTQLIFFNYLMLVEKQHRDSGPVRSFVKKNKKKLIGLISLIRL